MMLQLCTMGMVHCKNVVWCPCQSYTPKIGYRWWKTAGFSHSVRTVQGTPPSATFTW